MYLATQASQLNGAGVANAAWKQPRASPAEVASTRTPRCDELMSIRQPRQSIFSFYNKVEGERGAAAVDAATQQQRNAPAACRIHHSLVGLAGSLVEQRVERGAPVH